MEAIMQAGEFGASFLQRYPFQSCAALALLVALIFARAVWFLSRVGRSN